MSTLGLVSHIDSCLGWARRLDAKGSSPQTRQIVERLEEMRSQAVKTGGVFHCGDGRLGLSRWWSGDWGVESWGDEGAALMEEVSKLQAFVDKHWKEFPR